MKILIYKYINRMATARLGSLSLESSREKKKQKPNELTLKYGIEIECVFELIDDFDAYNHFINFCINDLSFDKKFDTFVSFINIVKNTISENEKTGNIEKNTDIINDFIYKELLAKKAEEDEEIRKQHEASEKQWSFNFLQDDIIDLSIYKTDCFNIFLKENIQKLIRIAKSEAIDEDDFIKNWTNFLNRAIILIKDNLETKSSDYQIGYSNYSSYEVINILLNGTTDIDDINKNLKQRFNLVPTNIKLFDDDNDMIHEFYEKPIIDDEINLFLVEDVSVDCYKKKVYKDIKSGELITYTYLLNKCEFLTQPFNNSDEINRKLSLFFDDTIIKKSLLNCSATSQHIHISFNKDDKNISPDIYIILTIVCVCHYFQNDIFKLFLITRTNNDYCKKLNYNNPNNESIINNDDDEVIIDDDNDNYNSNLEKILTIFYEGDKRYSRYYWLNLMNLYKTDISMKPYTIEFRLKHGSSDAEELANISKLYANIINYSIKLSEEIKGITNINEIKEIIGSTITRNKGSIFNDEILNSIKYYFTSENSDYVIGLNRLNSQLQSDERTGGKQKPPSTKSLRSLRPSKSLKLSFEKKLLEIMNDDDNLLINKFINYFEDKPIYKYNSFGLEYIGKGFNKLLQKKLRDKFKSFSIYEGSTKTNDNIISDIIEDLKYRLNINQITIQDDKNKINEYLTKKYRPFIENKLKEIPRTDEKKIKKIINYLKLQNICVHK